MNLQNKKILIFDKYLGYNVGGAQKSLHELLKKMSGDFVYLGCVVKKSFNAGKNKIDDLPIDRFKVVECGRFPYLEYFLQRRIIKKNIQKQNANILITQGISGAVGARYFCGKVVYFIRDEYQLNRIPVYQTGLKRVFKFLYLFVQYPFIYQMFKDQRLAIKKADVVIANSVYIQKEVKRIFKKDSKVIYPLVDTQALQNKMAVLSQDKQFITLIGSELIKGRAIVEHIATLMPTQQFIIVGREFTQQKWKKNILYQPWVDDVIDIYQKTKLLLIPSICNEAFGRTALEAMILGLPVIGSNRGGLTEVLSKKSVVDDLYDFLEWKTKIEEALNNKEEYINKELAQFDCNLQIDNFKNIISTL